MNAREQKRKDNPFSSNPYSNSNNNKFLKVNNQEFTRDSEIFDETLNKFRPSALRPSRASDAFGDRDSFIADETYERFPEFGGGERSPFEGEAVNKNPFGFEREDREDVEQAAKLDDSIEEDIQIRPSDASE